MNGIMRIQILVAVIVYRNSLDTHAFSDLFCSNDASFRFEYDGQTRDCPWIVPQSDEVTKTLCRDTNIRFKCLHSCGLCCEDNIFFRVATLDGEHKTCSWIGQSEETKLQYCNLKQNGIYIREVCAATCNFCEPFIPMMEEPSHVPSMPPTVLPTSAPSMIQSEQPSLPKLPPSMAPVMESLEPCTDNTRFVFSLSNGSQQNCAWITGNEVKKQDRQMRYCQNPEILENCQEACDACSNHNTHQTTTTTITPSTSPSQGKIATNTPTSASTVILPPPTTATTITTTEKFSSAPTPNPTSPPTNAKEKKSNPLDGSFSSTTGSNAEEPGGEDNVEKKEKKSAGSKATWLLSFFGIFLLIAAIVRIVGRKRENHVTMKQTTKDMDTVVEGDGGAATTDSSWIVTFLSGSLCSDLSCDDDDE